MADQNNVRTLRINPPPRTPPDGPAPPAGAGGFSPRTPEFGGRTPEFGNGGARAEGEASPAYGSTPNGGAGAGGPRTPEFGGPPLPATPPFGAANAPWTPPMGRTPNGSPPGRTPNGAPPLSGEGGVHPKNPNTILARKLLKTYFKTFNYPFTRHHIDSFDTFISQDLPAIIKSNNPILNLKEFIPELNTYMYKVECFVGGIDGTAIRIGTPTISLQKAKEVRVLFPNEARLRNLTYCSTVYADIVVRVTMTFPGKEPQEPKIVEYKNMPLFIIPILLHSRFCVLHNKPSSFLTQAGECPQDQGGYFIIDGAEKVLITRQEQAFNTLYILKQENNDKIETFGNIVCLNPQTRQVKVVSFFWNRALQTLHVNLPMVRKPIPIFVLFRAMGVQADEDILRLIYPDLESAEAKAAIPELLASISEAVPFFDSFSATQFIKAMTKGFSIEHVYDILFNQTFIHITDIKGGSRVHFLADCVRKFMRVHLGVDEPSSRDDVRNQRCLTSGQLIRMLFNNAYTNWKKQTRLNIDLEYKKNRGTYSGEKFMNIFSEGNADTLFNLRESMITEGIMRGFKGKWVTGGAGGGGQMGHSDEKTGVLQAMSRIGYLDFMSHTRRVVLNFDAGDKNPRPRLLHTSQYGYFCTNETPSGGHIGLTKNLSLLTSISNASDPNPIQTMLLERAWILPCSEMRTDLLKVAVPFFLNNGLIGYTLQPNEIVSVLKLLKWTGCLPPMSSIGFSLRSRKVFLFVDEGRVCRPLIHIHNGRYPRDTLEAATTWRELVVGSYEATSKVGVSTTSFTDPFRDRRGPIPFAEYKAELEPHIGVIEYVDSYEQNEASLVSFPEEVTQESTHCEIHPCTIVSIVNGMIPFAQHNQSPRNQLSCSQSKQALSLYATNFQNRYDNTANILCYGQAPLVRTLQYDVLGEGAMPYGQNLIMAIMAFQGYNQDDGIVFNLDSFQRGMFRNMNYRSYTAYEEYDKISDTRTIIANPLKVPQWTDLRPGLDYTKLDERGIIEVGKVVDENTVLVGRYILDKSGKTKDASVTAQVWTTGRVESVVVMVGNPTKGMGDDPKDVLIQQGNLMVKVRITQDRVPELGDKFSTRHGQKGTIGMRFRSHDLPRTADGLVPDMIVNPHCIPSRMTVAQLMEMLFGDVCYNHTTIGDATIFMSDEKAPEAIGRILESQMGMERTGNKILYDGATGVQMETTIFMGPVFGMRLKHMVEDKWNARAEGRREQRTHQPTGGRGAQGGLRIGEMERDAIAGHGMSRFLRESLMERSDKTTIRVCNGCGTVPIFNEKQNLFICSLCDGPVQFIGNTPENLEILPTVKRSLATSSLVEIPFATKLLAEELSTYMNMGMRFLTTKGLEGLKDPVDMSLPADTRMENVLKAPLATFTFPDHRVPQYREPPKEVQPSDENLYAMGVIQMPGEEEVIEPEGEAPVAAAAAPGKKGELRPYGPDGLFQDEDGNLYDPMGQPITPGSEDNIAARQREASTRIQIVPAGSPPVTPNWYTPGGTLIRDGQRVEGAAAAAPSPAYGAATPPYGPTAPPGLAPTAVAPAGGPQTPPFQSGGGFIQSGGGTMQPGPSFIQSGGGYIIPAPIVYQAPVPMASAPPTIVIDTSPQAMHAEGYQPEMQMAARGMPVMGGGGAHRRHVTPRARPMSPRGSRAPATIGGQSFNPAARITINKLG